MKLYTNLKSFHRATARIARQRQGRRIVIMTVQSADFSFVASVTKLILLDQARMFSALAVERNCVFQKECSGRKKLSKQMNPEEEI